ncbi:MAG: HD-GYP domain-containing protein [Acidimicrobiales bacterium]
MRGSRRWVGIAAMLLGPLLPLMVLRAVIRIDARLFSAHTHLVIVSALAVLALAIAAVAVVTANSSRHPGLVYLACGSAGLGIFMLGHGLTTPGVLGQPSNAWVGRLPHLAVAVFAVGLHLASGSVDTRVGRFVSGHASVVVPLVVATMAVGTGVVVADPSLVPLRAWEENVFDVVSSLIVVVCLTVVLTHWRRWRLGSDAVQLALTFAAAMTMAATLSLEHGRMGRLSWWDYHANLLAGFSFAVYAVARRGQKSRAVTGVLQTAFTDDPFEHIVRGYPDALRQLVKAVEVKDAYTHGHSERTARVATELGLRMRLRPDVLRVIARGAYLHDLGKIGIPDHILNKPGQLTPDERATISTHPQLGYEIACGSAPLTEVLGVILHHHERYDGGGYPHGLTGAAIPLEARVVMVADVWDALTSDRAYRRGWGSTQALAHIEAGRGTHFDPSVVDAMVDLAAEWGIGRDDRPGSAEAGWAAAQSCHHVEPEAELVGV